MVMPQNSLTKKPSKKDYPKIYIKAIAMPRVTGDNKRLKIQVFGLEFWILARLRLKARRMPQKKADLYHIVYTLPKWYTT